MSGTLNDLVDDADDLLDDAVDEVNQVADDVENEIDDTVDDLDEDDGMASTTSPAAQVTRLYDAAFDREPEDAGLTLWVNTLRAGADLEDLAKIFVESLEFQERFEDADNAEFVTLLYQNAFEREPEEQGLSFWTDALASGRLDRDDVLLAISESEEHVLAVGPVSTGDNPLI